MRARTNPLSCSTVFSTAPLDRGSCAGGASATACSPSFSATPARRSTKAGSLSVLSSTLRRCPNRRMLETA
eukprot:6675806-Alexandrium_andersonii.AAC.1